MNELQTTMHLRIGTKLIVPQPVRLPKCSECGKSLKSHEGITATKGGQCLRKKLGPFTSTFNNYAELEFDIIGYPDISYNIHEKKPFDNTLKIGIENEQKHEN